MKQPKIILLTVMLFALPVILYVSSEYLMGQILFFSQLLVLWGLLPFLFRNERSAPKEWSKRILVLTFLIVGGAVVPFLIHLGKREKLESTDITHSAVRMFSEISEIFLILGICLATFFVIATLVKRRGAET